jgi:hypothetical protein
MDELIITPVKKLLPKNFPVIFVCLLIGLISSSTTFVITNYVQGIKTPKMAALSNKENTLVPSVSQTIPNISPTIIIPTINQINTYLTSTDMPVKTYENTVYGFSFNYPAFLTLDEKNMEIGGAPLNDKKIYVEVSQNSLLSCQVDCDVIKNLGQLTISNTQAKVFLGAKKTPSGQLSGQYVSYEFAPNHGYWTYITLKFENNSPLMEQIAILQQIALSFLYTQKREQQPPLLTPKLRVPLSVKPVIYLYPQHEQDIYVRLTYLGTLLSTYPDYDYSIMGWKVKAFPDGKIVNLADQQEYNYIFWDGETSLNIYDLKKGFVVKGSDTKTFLQLKLKEIGLIPKEYNEFIVYWLPKLQKNNYNLIYFAGEEYTNTAKLDVYPKPDSMLRVFMTYKPLNKRIDVPHQDIKPFTRKGFAVVEWGGREIE